MELKKQTVLITGATGGLGKSLTITLARLGCNLIIHGKDKKKVEALSNEIREVNPSSKISTIVCDFNKPSEIIKCFSDVKQLDILINNAGVWAEGETIEITPEKIIELTNVNLLSYLLVTRILLPILKKSSFSQILNVSSIAGIEIPQDYFHTIYSATKFGVQGFSEALAKEFYNKKMRIMGYYPGGMSTDFFIKAGIDYKSDNAWMFNPQESVASIIFMLTRNPKVSIKRMDLINQQES
mgnify:CR=1 FL=1